MTDRLFDRLHAAGDAIAVSPRSPDRARRNAERRRRRRRVVGGLTAGVVTAAIVVGSSLVAAHARTQDIQPATPPAPVSSQGDEVSNSRSAITGVVTSVCVAAAGCSNSPESTDGTAVVESTAVSSTATELPVLFDGTDGPLEPGTYRTPWLGQQIEITVPDKWSTALNNYVARIYEVFMAFNVVTHIYDDACAVLGDAVPVGNTTAEIVQSLVDQKGTESTTPIATEVAGIPATKVVLSSTAADPGTCTKGHARIMWDIDGDTFITLPGETWALYVLELNGKPGILSVATYATASEDARLQAEGVVASLKIA